MGSSGRSRSVLALAVSDRIPTTVACCQRPTGGADEAGKEDSVTLITLLSPGIAVIVVAVSFPESKFVVVQ